MRGAVGMVVVVVVVLLEPMDTRLVVIVFLQFVTDRTLGVLDLEAYILTFNPPEEVTRVITIGELVIPKFIDICSSEGERALFASRPLPIYINHWVCVCVSCYEYS